MTPSDYNIAVDLAAAAADEAIAAILRKTSLMPPGQDMLVLRIALGMLALKHRALATVAPLPGIDAVIAGCDEREADALRAVFDASRARRSASEGATL